jgi:hypothetical protein
MLMRLAAGDKKSGCVRVLYDTTWSTRGVVQTVGRKPRGKNPFDFQVIWVLCPSSQNIPDVGRGSLDTSESEDMKCVVILCCTCNSGCIAPKREPDRVQDQPQRSTS